MNYQYTTIDFAGIQLDTFLTEDGQAWVTLSSIAKEVGGSRQNMKDWLAKKSGVGELPVKVGQFRKAATAYPVSVVADYIDYRVSLGDKRALALYSATFRADLDRSIKEANGHQVTSAQHEENRHTTRLALLEQWVTDHYSTNTWLHEEVMIEAGFTDPVEQDIMSKLAFIKDKEALLANPKSGSLENRQYWQNGINTMQQEIQELTVGIRS